MLRRLINILYFPISHFCLLIHPQICLFADQIILSYSRYHIIKYIYHHLCKVSQKTSRILNTIVVSVKALKHRLKKVPFPKVKLSYMQLRIALFISSMASMLNSCLEQRSPSKGLKTRKAGSTSCDLL